MSRFSSAALAALATVTLAACADTPNAPLSSGNAPVVQASVSPAGPEQVVGGEVVVKLRAGVDAAGVAAAHGLSVGEHGYKDAFVVLHGAAGREHANAAALKGDSRVEYAEPN